ncbi:hypothetical protein BV20DRAFT_984023 [Pilatotrama ljubarskyi]|nr:hypothetical protein BV20DRAFT_984092 [Pilatotrama ljubarskyi]KAI0363077.1 hypothetical protein BV20DRAFT_984023 [Pilatotrama ljubarskyi]
MPFNILPGHPFHSLISASSILPSAGSTSSVQSSSAAAMGVPTSAQLPQSVLLQLFNAVTVQNKQQLLTSFPCRKLFKLLWQVSLPVGHTFTWGQDTHGATSAVAKRNTSDNGISPTIDNVQEPPVAPKMVPSAGGKAAKSLLKTKKVRRPSKKTAAVSVPVQAPSSTTAPMIGISVDSVPEVAPSRPKPSQLPDLPCQAADVSTARAWLPFFMGVATKVPNAFKDTSFRDAYLGASNLGIAAQNVLVEKARMVASAIPILQRVDDATAEQNEADGRV